MAGRERGVGGGDAFEEGEEEVGGGGGGEVGEAEGGEVAGIGDEVMFGAFDGAEEDEFEVGDALVFLEGARGEGFIDEALEDFDDELEDGEVCGGAFLDVEDADFDGAAGEAGDGAAGVGPLRFKDAFGVVGGEVAGDAVEDEGMVAGLRGDLFGDDAAGDGGDAGAIAAVGVEAHVEEGCGAAVGEGGGSGEGGEEWEE